jgi:hypothetical protein
MRRRSFFQAAVAAAAATTLAGRGALGAGSEFESRLLAFAAVVVPGPDSATWQESEVARALLARINSTARPNARKRYGAALEKLDRAAISGDGKSYFELADERQARLLKELNNSDKDFDNDFGAMREDMMRAFFSSTAGMKFTGYRDATQFEGYPEFFQLAEIWE